MPEADLTKYMSLDMAKGFCNDCHAYNSMALCEKNRKVDGKPATNVPKMKAFYQLRDEARFTALAAAQRELNILSDRVSLYSSSEGRHEDLPEVRSMKSYLERAMHACSFCSYDKSEMLLVIAAGEKGI